MIEILRFAISNPFAKQTKKIANKKKQKKQKETEKEGRR